MLNNQETILNLKSHDSQLRIKGAEEIRDIYEFEYQYSIPSQDLTDLFVNQLVDSVLIEKDKEVQYLMLDALYAWAWFPYYGEAYDKLANGLGNLLDQDFLVLSLEILIAGGGEKKYENIYRKYSISDLPEIRNVAEKGLSNLKKQSN